MSNFLIEDSTKTFKDRVLGVFSEALSDPLNPLFDVFKASIPGYLEINPPTLPVTQITGFTQFLGSSAFTSATVSTSATSYTSLTGGPSLPASGEVLPSGSYLLLYGAQANTAAATALYLSPSVNSATPSDTVAAAADVGDFVSVMSATLVTLPNATNTVEVQYKSAGAVSQSFSNRFLIALKVANL